MERPTRNRTRPAAEKKSRDKGEARLALRHVLAALPPLVAFVLQWMFWPAIKPYAWFLFYPAVFFSSWIGGLPAGLTSSLVSVALAWWFFIPPEHVLMKGRPGSLLSAGVFMSMGVLFSISHGRLRKANEKAASALAAARSANDQLQVANGKITGLLEKTRELDHLKTQFFANVSHELRTPLALIIGPTEKLLASSAADDRTRGDLDVIARNARLLLKHVNDLLDVSKLEAGKMKLRYVETDLAQLVRLVASHFDSLAQEKRLTYEVDAGGVQRAQVDPDKYQRILLNLLSNAFKFTPAAGRVRCSLRALRNDDGQSLAVLEVADSGPGVRPEHRESVFERFRQVEGGATRRFGGTGLGLAIARDFVALHGGAISVTDAPEGGALFRVETPALAPQGAEIGAMAFEVPVIAEAAHHAVEELRIRAEAVLTPSSNGQPVVLVVEDNPDMNDFIRNSLASGYRTESASDGHEGLAKALDLRPDLVLSDVMMPGMSGDALVKEIRARPELDSVPIMLLTAKADDELRVRVLREGAQDYLMKPFSADELRARVGNLVKVKLADERNRRLNDELTESNHRLQGMTSQLESASKELEAFSYSVAHDLRAPLRSIDGFSQALVEDCADRLDADGKRYLKHVRESAQQMGELIDDLLNLSRVTRAELRRERVDLSELVRSVLERLRKSQPERQVEVVIQDGLVAQADLRLLDVILTNLLGNAWKFTGKRAAARIEFAAEAGEHPPVYFVRDNGAGFDGSYVDRLFGVFQRLHTSREFEGTGIGLATVQRIVGRHGGRVWAEGEVDRGATFYFSLEEGRT